MMVEHGSTGAAPRPELSNLARPFVFENGFYRWKLPSGTQIEFSSGAARVIGEDALRKSMSETGDEFGGLLISNAEAVSSSTLRIVRAESRQSDNLHKLLAQSSVRVLSPSAARASVLMRTSITGFYRVVSRTEQPVLSQVDLNLANWYFPGPGKVFLLIDEFGSRARVFVREETGFDSELLNFPVAATAAAEPAGLRMAGAEHSSQLPVWSPEEPEARLEPDDQPGRRRFRRIGAATLAVLALCAGVWFMAGTVSEELPAGLPDEPSLGLRIHRTDEGVMLTWDSKSSDIASAKAGLVTIKDGPNQRELLLTQQQLAGGRLFYLPASEIVQFTFQVFTEAGVLRDHAAATMPPRASIFSGATQQLQPAAPRSFANPPPLQSSNSATMLKGGITPETRKPSGRSPTIPIRTSPTVGAGAPAPMQSEKSNSSASAGAGSMEQPVVAANQSLPALTPSAVEQLVPTTSTQAPPSSAQPTAPSPPADQAAGNAASTPAQNPVQDVVPRTYIPPRAILQTKPSVPGNLQALITREIVVEVNLTIGADGSILRAEAVPGEGPIHKSLSELALATAKLWKFRPAREGTQNVSGEVQIQFQFGPDR